MRLQSPFSLVLSMEGRCSQVSETQLNPSRAADGDYGQGLGSPDPLTQNSLLSIHFHFMSLDGNRSPQRVLLQALPLHEQANDMGVLIACNRGLRYIT